MSDTAVQLSQEQVDAMMTWQMHAATWVVSQAIALTQVSDKEGLDLDSDDIMSAAVELYKVARADDAQREAT